LAGIAYKNKNMCYSILETTSNSNIYLQQGETLVIHYIATPPTPTSSHNTRYIPHNIRSHGKNQRGDCCLLKLHHKIFIENGGLIKVRVGKIIFLSRLGYFASYFVRTCMESSLGSKPNLSLDPLFPTVQSNSFPY